MIGYAILAAVAILRLAELGWARRNTRKLLNRGAVEVGRTQYPIIVAVHAAWLAAMALFMPATPKIHVVPLVLFAALQPLRLWVFASLGPYFTTRVITLPGAPLVQDGPYRFMRHPNYLIVAGEVLLLPLAFGEVIIAALFSLLNVVLLVGRIRVEDAALAERSISQPKYWRRRAAQNRPPA